MLKKLKHLACSCCLLLLGCSDTSNKVDASRLDTSTSIDATADVGAKDGPTETAVVDATADMGGCSISQKGTLTDDNSAKYSFAVNQLPATLSLTMTTDMVQPQVRIKGAFGTTCVPANCGSVTIPKSNPTLTLSHTFTATGAYTIQVDNFDTGGSYSLSGAIGGDSTACATWK